jgi:hypothetical protein
MEVIYSSEASVYVRTTRLYIPEDSNIHIWRCETPKSYKCIRVALPAICLEDSGINNARPAGEDTEFLVVEYRLAWPTALYPNILDME